MEEYLKKNLPAASTELIAGSGGVFDVKIDGRLIFSKFQAGRFPENQEILNSIRKTG
jgi:selenoprotein W-related protein